jgi:uncharacterized protein (DUF2336 family)
MLKRLFGGSSGKQSFDYEKAKVTARDENSSVRRRLAARTDVQPEILFYLADDAVAEVRREVAVNEAAPRQVDIKLAGDADEEVRCGLANKIARLAPGLTAAEQDKVRQLTYQTLEVLARDQTTRVRQILAETLKDVADAPPEVIGRLARDAEIVVAGPVLEFSPVLSDADLLEIIAASPIAGALDAISRRTRVGEQVSDAIVDTDDVGAIAVLLANPSAQIREETLDYVVDRAIDVESWHLPLVNRPRLSPGIAGKLARFVADHLVAVLTQRRDLDPETAAAVNAEVRKRLDSGDGDDDARDAGSRAGDGLQTEDPLEIAKRLHGSGELTAETIADALDSGNRDFAMAALAALAGMRLEIVEKTVSNRSIKGIVSVAWKAGLPARFAEILQLRLAHVAPKDVLRASDGNTYPLSNEDLTWQLDFLNDL